ncbi:MAG TPA: tetratricopeptide repeat protein [Bryobacteraceae bacterium]|nr:tetratricopeptide repeat protein [Bryobacteraceae bacterium]
MPEFLPEVAVVCIVLFVAWTVRYIGRGQFALRAVMSAHKRGDHATALRKADGLKRTPAEPAPYFFFRGASLYHLGRLDEAEKTLREGLSHEKDDHAAALVRETLGTTLLEEGRYDEARACFEDCARSMPNRGGGHRAVAELLLRKGACAEEALARARQAVDMDRSAPVWNHDVHRLNLSESLATLAWAVAALSGNAEEVERLLSEAFALCGTDVKPVLAQLHYHAGRAYSALGKPEKGSHHFVEAVRADPAGNFGRLARAHEQAGQPR